MLVLGIDIAATHTWHHIDQVEFDDTCNISPLVLACTFCFLFFQFQINT